MATATESSSSAPTEIMAQPAYEPMFCMPILSIGEAVPAISLEKDSLDRLSLNILTDVDSLSVYSMTGGTLYYQPMPSTDGSDASTITLALQIFGIDQHKVNEQIEKHPFGKFPFPDTILYENLDLEKVRLSLEPFFAEQKEAALKQAWQEAIEEGTITASTTPNSTLLIENLKKRFYEGKRGLAVKLGKKIGVAALDSAISKHRLNIKFTQSDGSSLSAYFYLKLFSWLDKDKWKDHILIKTMDVDFKNTIYLKFECWNESITDFSSTSIPEFIPVESKKVVLQGLSRTFEANTDADGKLSFEFPTSEFYCPNFETVTLKAVVKMDSGTWSTEGWDHHYLNNLKRDTRANYPEIPMGTASVPISIPVGLDFHVRLIFDKIPATVKFYAPKGIPVKIGKDSKDDSIGEKEFRTTKTGDIHGAVFDIKAGEKIYLHFDLEIQDADIGLNRSTIPVSSLLSQLNHWVSPDDPRPIFGQTLNTISIGSRANPKEIEVQGEHAYYLYALKVLRELTLFLHNITNKTWESIENLKLNYFEGSVRSFSWPIGQVNISIDDKWNRSTLIHEMSHQFLWREADISSIQDIAYEFVFGIYISEHDAPVLTNSLTSLWEGWADFMMLFFSSALAYRGKIFSSSIIYMPKGVDFNSFVQNQSLVTSVPNTDFKSTSFNNLIQDAGESIEGTFALGLIHLVHELVLKQSFPTAIAVVTENSQADIDDLPINQWIKDPDAANRFVRLICGPLRQLRNSSDREKITTAMLKNIAKAATESEWNTIVPILIADYKMASTISWPVL